MDIITTYPTDNYPIYVERGVLDTHLESLTNQYESVFYIIDENVYSLYKNSKLKNIKNPITVTGGESFKYASPLMETVELLLERDIKRNSLLVVIGGGATGDAGGFIASMVLRGVDYIHVPTTLLAHDSAIGGKTAINSKHGKNLIGAFYRPKAVIYDLEFLDSLSESEKLSGFGEVFKHALLSSEADVNQLMLDTKDEIQIDTLTPYIIQGIQTKMHFVIEDEHESGSRKFLNLGHTLGHALEYNYKIPHGQAVMLGIIASLHLSNKVHNTEYDLDAYNSYMKYHGYPVHLLKEMDIDVMLKLIEKDKKNHLSGVISYVLFNQDSQLVVTDLKIETLKEYLLELRECL